MIPHRLSLPSNLFLHSWEPMTFDVLGLEVRPALILPERESPFVCT